MKLAILSRAPRAYSTQRLRTAALDRGHQVQGAQHAALRHRPVRAGAGPAVPRAPALRLRRDPAAHRQLDHLLRHRRRAPVRADGRLHAEHRQRHRELPRQAARHADPVPPQHRHAGDDVRAQPRRRACPAIERVGGAPVVIKLLEGTQGIGVILAPEIKIAEAIIETLHSTKQNVLIQSFVSESRGRDIRALVVGDRVVAAMRRARQGRRVPLQRAPRRHASSRSS